MQNQQNPMYGGQGMSSMGYGQSTLAQFGSNPQMVRSHISESGGQGYQQGYGPQAYAGNYAQMGGNMHGTSMMHVGATNPQVVQQHIAQDLGYGYQNGYQGGYSNQGYGGVSHSVMHAGATNPQVVQQHIAQDLGYNQGYQHGYPAQSMGSSAPYSQGAFSQVMHAAPASVQGGQGMSNMGYGQSMGHQGAVGAFSQYGTDPQMVQQHIRQDLANGVGTMTSEQAGAYRGQSHPMMQAQTGYYAPTGTFAQYGTNPQVVRDHINQDLRFQ